MYEIEFYEDKNGKSEIQDYIKNLQKSKSKDNIIKFKKIITYIELLSRNGLSLNENYIKKITEEIWELRPLKDRIMFANFKDNKFILLSIFTKKTNKTPKREIQKAQRFFDNYKKEEFDNE